MRCSVARRSSRPPCRALVAASWRRRRTGSTGSGSSSASFLASSYSAVVMLSKSAFCSRSRSEKVKCVSNCTSSLARLVGRVGRLRRLGRGQRLGQAVGARRALLLAAAADLGQQQVHHLLEQLRVAPEGVEGGVEQRLLLVALEHHRAQRRMHVVAPLQAHQFHRRQRGQHAVRPDGHAGAAQHAREVDDVVGDHGASEQGFRAQLVQQLGGVAALHLAPGRPGA